MLNIGVHYAEDDFPEGQEPIATENNRKFETYVSLLTYPKTTPKMGVATGKAGVGKTFGINKFITEYTQNDSQYLPTIAKFKVTTTATARQVARELCRALGETPSKSKNTEEIAEEAVKFIERNGTKLIFVDEADRLNAKSYDIIRFMFDRTHCTFVIVGLPEVLDVVDGYPQFKSRVGPRMEFVNPDIDEVLDTILPQLTIFNWHYDVENEADRNLGELAWTMSRSFRRLRDLIESAGVLADKKNETCITEEFLRDAFEAIANDEDIREVSNEKASPPYDPSLEEESELRKDAKNKKD